jgi:hypothetical protein
MADKQTELDVNKKDQLVLLRGINRDRQTILARLDPPGGYQTIYWVSRELRDTYHKSVAAFLPTLDIHIVNHLIEGQVPDVVPAKAPPEPKLHPLQGDLTPDYLDWLYKWAPVRFENTLGVYLREFKQGEEKPSDPRECWVRDTVVRTVTQPVEGTNGGQYLTTKFTAEEQIIARRASHLTFTKKEIYRERRGADGEMEQVTTEPFKNVYSHETLERMEKNNSIRVLSKRPGTASAGAAF